jgi:hypothetical protein
MSAPTTWDYDGILPLNFRVFNCPPIDFSFSSASIPAPALLTFLSTSFIFFSSSSLLHFFSSSYFLFFLSFFLLLSYFLLLRGPMNPRTNEQKPSHGCAVALANVIRAIMLSYVGNPQLQHHVDCRKTP